MQVYTVAQVAGYIHNLLDVDPVLQDVWVEGEVSNYFQSSAGHIYFTLKDSEAQLRCVLWRTQVPLVECLPADGDAVLVHGRASLYEAQGNCQLYLDQIQPVGAGALFQQLEALKARLASEGLFAPERKRPLPMFPQVVGVVTSPTGAAIRDILNVLHRRYPLAEVIVAPTLVQGAEAPPQIVTAIEALNAREDIDVMIVARGGGSLEELWAFNDERVARAIFASRVPVVTGVGHEKDWTICDWVADVRAPTPSAAAEIVVPDQNALRDQVTQYRSGIRQSVLQHLASHRSGIEHSRTLLRRFSPRATIERRRLGLNVLQERLTNQQLHRQTLSRRELEGLQAQLYTLSPLATLERGYAIVSRGDTGQTVTSVTQVQPELSIDVQVRDGHFAGKVIASENDPQGPGANLGHLREAR
jgi:exodeoxyribonuclease VII large subunit